MTSVRTATRSSFRSSKNRVPCSPGWHPWNIFGEEPQNEKLIKEIVDAVIRLENTEPVSARPMSAVYYDVDLEVLDDVAGVSK